MLQTPNAVVYHGVLNATRMHLETVVNKSILVVTSSIQAP
jgi:hypothetical protein